MFSPENLPLLGFLSIRLTLFEFALAYFDFRKNGTCFMRLTNSFGLPR